MVILSFQMCKLQSSHLKKSHSLGPAFTLEIKQVNPKGNQPWIFIGRIDAEAPILWPPDAKCQPIGKELMLGKAEGRRRRGPQRSRLLDGITDSTDMSLSWWGTGRLGMLWFMGSQRDGHDWVTELNWTCVTVSFLEIVSNWKDRNDKLNY